jgi:hypothetical protein
MPSTFAADDPWAYHDWQSSPAASAGTTKSWSLYDLVEPFVRSGSSFLAGLYSSSASFFGALDQWTRVMEAKTGFGRGGLFEEIAKGQQQWAAYFAARGLDPQAGGPVALAHYIYSGLGRASFDIPTIYAMGLPGYSGMHGGAEAARNGGSAAEGAARGAVCGLLLHGIMKALNYLPVPERLTANGLVFSGSSLMEELQKPAGARNYEKVVADFMMGVGLSAGGGPGKSRQELARDLYDAYRPQIQRAAAEVKQAVEQGPTTAAPRPSAQQAKPCGYLGAAREVRPGIRVEADGWTSTPGEARASKLGRLVGTAFGKAKPEDVPKLKQQLDGFLTAVDGAQQHARFRGWNPETAPTRRVVDSAMERQINSSLLNVRPGERDSNYMFGLRKGWWEVHTHGLPDTFVHGNEVYSPSVLAAELRAAGHTNQPVVLPSCHTGAAVGRGVNAAQGLANELRVPVVAPSTAVLEPMAATSFVLLHGGEWKLFLPQ